MDGNDAYNTIIKCLKERGIPFTIHEHEVARTVTDAEENLPFPKESFLAIAQQGRVFHFLCYVVQCLYTEM